MSAFVIISCNNQTTLKTESFKVWGNCEHCQETIIKACSIDGITEKDWNIDSKICKVKFDTTKISLDVIQKLIAKSGYDNVAYVGDSLAYSKLRDCCQYERKPLN